MKTGDRFFAETIKTALKTRVAIPKISTSQLDALSENGENLIPTEIAEAHKKKPPPHATSGSTLECFRSATNLMAVAPQYESIRKPKSVISIWA